MFPLPPFGRCPDHPGSDGVGSGYVQHHGVDDLLGLVCDRAWMPPQAGRAESSGDVVVVHHYVAWLRVPHDPGCLAAARRADDERDLSAHHCRVVMGLGMRLAWRAPCLLRDPSLLLQWTWAGAWLLGWLLSLLPSMCWRLKLHRCGHRNVTSISRPHRMHTAPGTRRRLTACRYRWPVLPRDRGIRWRWRRSPRWRWGWR